MSSGMFRHVVHVRTDVSEELSASFNRVTKIGELGTTLAVTSNRHTLCVSVASYSVHPFLQEPHGVTSQKTPFFNYLLFSLLPAPHQFLTWLIV
jgi:hypothetical protein